MVIDLPYFELRRNINRFLGSTTLDEYRTMILISKNGKLRQILNDGTAIMVYQVPYDGPEFNLSVDADAFKYINIKEADIEIEDDIIYAVDDKRITVLNAAEAVWFWDNTHPIYDMTDKEPIISASELRYLYHKICFQPKLIDNGLVTIKMDTNRLSFQTYDETYYMVSYTNNFKRKHSTTFDVHYRNLAHVIKTIRKTHDIQLLSQGGKFTIVAKRMQDLYNFILPKYSSSFTPAPIKNINNTQKIDLRPIQKDIVDMALYIFRKNVPSSQLVIDKFHLAVYYNGSEHFTRPNKTKWPSGFVWNIRLTKRFAIYMSKLTNPLLLVDGYKTMINGVKSYMWEVQSKGV